MECVQTLLWTAQGNNKKFAISNCQFAIAFTQTATILQISTKLVHPVILSKKYHADLGFQRLRMFGMFCVVRNIIGVQSLLGHMQEAFARGTVVPKTNVGDQHA